MPSAESDIDGFYENDELTNLSDPESDKNDTVFSFNDAKEVLATKFKGFRERMEYLTTVEKLNVYV